MKIKAVMLGLAFSGLIGFASDDLVEYMEKNGLNSIPSNDPMVVQEVIKAVVRMDRREQIIQAALYEASDVIQELAKQVKTLQIEVKQLKQQQSKQSTK